jgi:hypothetical protein
MVAGKRSHVPRRSVGDLANRRVDLRGLTAPVACVILDQTVDPLRWHPKFSQRERKVFGRYVDEFDFASNRLSDCMGNFCVRE